MKPPIDLDSLYAAFVQDIGDDRGDEHRLHGSDLGGCDYATYLRLQGNARLPFDEDTIARFFTGHMVENYVVKAVKKFEESGPHIVVRHGHVIDYKGIVGHLDLDITGPSGNGIAVIDVRTTRGKVEPQYSHVLKSAFYADAIGADTFCEWVFKVTFGKIAPPVAFWFETVQWLDALYSRIDTLKKLEFDGLVPAIEPPVQYRWSGEAFEATGGLETWRCEKYCNAICPRNALVTPDELAEMAEQATIDADEVAAHRRYIGSLKDRAVT